nr:hypothetical protein [Actinomycetales bacterium]
MAINGWEVTPAAVEVVLNRVQEEATHISGAISDNVFAELSEDLITESGGAPVNGITGQVPMAINNLMSDQAGDLRAIFDRIS